MHFYRPMALGSRKHKARNTMWGHHSDWGITEKDHARAKEQPEPPQAFKDHGSQGTTIQQGKMQLVQ